MAGNEGSVFGKYFLLKKIASGGMGEIYLAKLKGPVGFEKLLVIKRILQHHLENQEFVDMFFAEARVAAQLTHSNIVQIYEMGEIEDCYYIGMEYVHGTSMYHVLDRVRARGERLHPAHAIDIIGKMCTGMSYAHNATNMSGESIGVIHRDLNPHNLLISYSGEVKIIDFGIAKSELSTHKTETGTIKGKFVYMSPEQSAADVVDKRSDLFSIGICAYEALTHVNPFAKKNVVLSLDAIQRHDPPPLAETSPELAALDPVVFKALTKKAEDRYSDCFEFRDALLELRKNGRIEAAPQTLAELMHDLFADQINDEKRMILDSDSANTSQIKMMQAGMEREHHSGSQPGLRLKTPGPYKGDGEPHSRMPFFVLLLTIAVLSSAAAAVVYTMVVEKRLAAAPAPIANLVRPPRPPPPPPAAPPAAPDTSKGEETTAASAAAKERLPNKLPKAGRKRKRNRRPPPRNVTAPETNQQPVDAIAPKPPPAPPPPTFGNLQISTVPPVKIFRNGSPSGQTFKLRAGAGNLVFGTGKDPKSDPFVVRIRYQVKGDKITYSINSEPWAIVRGNGGIGLGRTPLAEQKGASKSVFEFVNPKERLTLRITLRYGR